jgi:hypothetical protein
MAISPKFGVNTWQRIAQPSLDCNRTDSSMEYPNGRFLIDPITRRRSREGRVLGGKGSFAPVPVNGGNAPIPAVR